MSIRRVADAVLKRQRPARIVTHDGAFHCDEALACFLLTKTKTFATHEIIRTRDSRIINAETSDVVVDVGGEFDAVRLRFDHHQRGFNDCFGHGFTTKLSSAGLVYREFGKEIIAEECEIMEDSKECETLWIAIYRNFMEAIDAIDNGINQYDFESLLKGIEQDKNPKPLFINNSGLSSRVGQLNTAWNDPVNDNYEKLREKQMVQFFKAMKMVGSEFVDSVYHHKNVWLPARAIVLSALERRFDFHCSGRAILLETRCFWKEHLDEIETELNIVSDQEKNILYVVYADDKGQYRIQCVSMNPSSFISRKPLPSKWRGVRDEDLSEIAGIDGCVFCHASGFIGGNKTCAGALKMVDKALEE